MNDYSQYQAHGPEWLKFVSDGHLPPPPEPEKSTPEAIRSAVNANRIEAAKQYIIDMGLAEKVAWQDYSIVTRDYQSIVARVYRPKHWTRESEPKLPVYLYFHGGGHMLGAIETEDSSCSQIVAAFPDPGILVVNVNYRHTPEFKHPKQYNDAWDAFEWLAANIAMLGGDPSRVVVGGISAGGGLAATTVLRAHEGGLGACGGLTIRGQLLCCPWLIHPYANPLAKEPHSSFQQNQDAPVLPWTMLKLFTDALGPAAKEDPYFSVALTEGSRTQGMPKAGFLIAGCDLLRDDGLYYNDTLKANDVPTKVHIFPGLPHGFRRFTNLQATQRWEALVVDLLLWSLSDDIKSHQAIEKS